MEVIQPLSQLKKIFVYKHRRAVSIHKDCFVTYCEIQYTPYYPCRDYSPCSLFVDHCRSICTPAECPLCLLSPSFCIHETTQELLVRFSWNPTFKNIMKNCHIISIFIQIGTFWQPLYIRLTCVSVSNSSKTCYIFIGAKNALNKYCRRIWITCFIFNTPFLSHRLR
jgi:hypothetical protein